MTAKSTAYLPPARRAAPIPCLDIVELLEVKGNRLKVRGMDALDGSILLDIKPYSAGIDSFPQAKIAWQKEGEA